MSTGKLNNTSKCVTDIVFECFVRRKLCTGIELDTFVE